MADEGRVLEGAIVEAEVKPRRRRKLLLVLVPVVAIIGFAYFYLTSGRYESTDNASLQTGQVAIAANVSGTAIAVEVEENQNVKTGQVLFRIDPDTFQTAVAEAEAQLAATRTDIESLRATYRQYQSDLMAAQVRLTYAQDEATRQQALFDRGFQSQAKYDEAMLAMRTAREAIEGARARMESARAGLSGDVDLPTDRQPSVQRAQASLDRTRLALAYTTVRAPQDGVVTRVHQLQVGSYVTASRPVFVLTGKRVWVVANFKESQLRYMRVGQPATVTIDAFPDRMLNAHVASFSPGTGNSFSLLPAENATGNWVKVVQRLPIELALDTVPDDLPLQAGLSAEVTVDTGHRSDLLSFGAPPSGAVVQ